MESIRVWLEPGYDQGRTGAWLLDWPGAFTYGATREIALARATSAAHRFVEWLASHGEQVEPAPAAHAEVVEEVAAQALPDGYVVNATFDPDEKPIEAREVGNVLRRLAYAREDLLRVVADIRTLESGGQSLPPDGRTLDEVLRHLAGAETWFISRLDATARYTGSREDANEYLEAARGFFAAGLIRLAAAQAPPRTDGKGERWTLAKVARRSLYHALDHLDELDRRLAKVERRVERVELRRNVALEPDELRRLFGATGLVRRAGDSDEVLTRTLAGSTETLAAFDGGALVGFARLLSDESTNAYVSTVAIAPRWQDRGLGTRLMRELMAGRESMKLVLEAATGAERFYERLGFERAPNAFVRPRGVS